MPQATARAYDTSDGLLPEDPADLFKTPPPSSSTASGSASGSDATAVRVRATSIRLPEESSAIYDPAREGHIFRAADGHVSPSLEARPHYANLFERVASNPENFRPDAVHAGIIRPAAASAGVQAFTKSFENGQVWVTVRNGLIENAGVNPPGQFR